MIEVTARLGRGPVYFAGETIKCYLTFRNIKSRPEVNDSPKKAASKTDTVAWASAQIICFCSVSESRVGLPESLLRPRHATVAGDSSQGATSLIPYKEDHGHCVLQTELKILLCDLRLNSGESREFCFGDVIPNDAFPSYRGPSVKYSYKITVAMQRVGAPVRVLRVPFRVLVVYGISDFKFEDKPTLSNPFMPPPEPTNLLDVASEVLSTITSRKTLHDYKIANADGIMAVFTLMKGSVRLGEDVVGVFDFSAGTVPCIQFTVCLQCEEVISEECQRKGYQGNAVISYEKHMQHCLFTKRTHIAIPVPLHATPGFLTDLVRIKWRLHFEFIVNKGPLRRVELETTQPGDRMWQGPAQLETRSMSWDLPIRVLPTMPLQAETSGSAESAFCLSF